ncbi:putative cinnamoyl-CoA reductase [Durotheca rogersii]|uniref:putative cinnamoyl-CoA reductase n=1 Tax=Durotheca rogersii TaxID=419775 RepID=UPI00221FB30D|nr:putative cinnamoyl-CoA reductase [Durotheca rogersii]KAI5855089.1 putative cinnamoyl-CoA reductase [Durotheca rogersii]
MTATFLITGVTGFIGFPILVAALAGGHTVRYMARTEEKARAVSSHPAVRALAPGPRLASVVLPDAAAEGAFDAALQGATHVIRAGSPGPTPGGDPAAHIFQPTVRVAAGLLDAALRAPSVRRVVVTSSIAGNIGAGEPPPPPGVTLSAATRVPPPEPPAPLRFRDAHEAYAAAKAAELRDTDAFVRARQPRFGVAHTCSNGVALALVTGGGAAAAARRTHLRAALAGGAAVPADLGLAAPCDFGALFAVVARAFPRAVAAGVFAPTRAAAAATTLPLAYDSADVERLLGRPLKTLDEAFLDVAAQYLEALGVEKA